MWEGCRNYTVRNLLRDKMKPGDQAFFYHSSVDPAGIAGTTEIVSEGYPDPTQFDPKSEYFDPKSDKDKPRWFALDVKLLRKYKRVVPLSELRSLSELSNMEVLKRGQRLSIMPVTEREWKIINDLPGI